jgi:hypothetical protein
LAQPALESGNYNRAIFFYAKQAAHDSQSGALSLLFVARSVVNNKNILEQVLADFVDIDFTEKIDSEISDCDTHSPPDPYRETRPRRALHTRAGSSFFIQSLWPSGQTFRARSSHGWQSRPNRNA